MPGRKSDHTETMELLQQKAEIWKKKSFVYDMLKTVEDDLKQLASQR